MSQKSFVDRLLSYFLGGSKKDPSGQTEFHDKIEFLKNSMLSYMKDAKPSYKRSDVEKCATILNNYLNELDKTTTKAEGMRVVKSTVMELNNLSEQREDLIETDEREQIAEIIILSSSKKGYNSPYEDITEEWREW